MLKTKNDVQIRVARLTDAPYLVKIYAPYVEKTVISFEYEVPTVDEFRNRMANTLKKYPYIVAERQHQIVGYAYVGPFKGRQAYDWAVETSIYVSTNERHHGVGKQLYQTLENICRTMGILNMNACIGYPTKEDEFLTKNSAQFHAHLGYRMVGEFHQCGYKFGRWYDMVWMEKIIGQHSTRPQAVKNFNDVRSEIAAQFDIQ